MKKPSQLEEAYHALGRLGSGPMSDEAITGIRGALGGASSLLVSRAAEIVGSRRLQELVPEMVAAFDRFMVDGVRTDKQCKAKTAIVNALNDMDSAAGDEVFLIGAHYVQMEPAFGGPADTAAGLRSGCALGLARTGHPDAHYILAELLVDNETPVRSAASKALAYLGSPESELMLRLKVLTGDREPEVMSECFTGLLAMSPGRSLDFVSRYLQSDDQIILEYAALAIGASRIPQAFDTLRECWNENPSPSTHRALLLPIALIRSDDALDFLIGIVRKSDARTALHAVSALSLYVEEHSVERIRAAVKARGDKDIADRFEHEFGR